jgi:Flp pilus assembly protein TadG
MIGSGVDASRAYMTKTRLQQACDAGVLAARKTMTGATLDTASRTQGQAFFTNNFPAGVFGSNTPVLTMTDGTDGEVIGRATANLPTGVMYMFGFEMFNLAADCRARLDIQNTDVMFVLDVTGSMASAVGSTTRIAALRRAVTDFHSTLESVKSGTVQVRYGFVPYSTTVNVGKLLPRATMVDDWVYQSREWAAWYNRAHNVSLSACNAVSGTRQSHDGHNDCYWTAADKTGASSSVPVWNYKQVSHPVSGYLTGNSTPVPTREPGTTENSTWAGCIEERDTVATATPYPIPSGAYDLDIDLAATTQATKWRPAWPEVSYARPSRAEVLNTTTNYNRPAFYCPAEGRKLAEMTAAQVSTYVSGLQPVGNTYHDSGMIWGARFISPDGIFGSENRTAPNGHPITRHIVFMTDGELVTNRDNYTLYGHEFLDARIGGAGASNATLFARHTARFDAICAAARAKNITIWVVAFGLPLTDSLRACASDAGKAFTSDNEAALRDQFRLIATNIAGLRLSR